jgi:hypothetical protein
MADDVPDPQFRCPICVGRLEVVYDRFHQKVLVCVDCHSGITVPDSAHQVARLKRDKKWPEGQVG